MIEIGSDEKAKYPFLGDAGAYLKEQGFTLEQFGTDPDLKSSVDIAYQRIKVASDGGIYKSPLGEDGKIKNQQTLSNETHSFLLAIVLLKQSKSHTLIKRFALAESRRAERYLEHDLGNMYEQQKVALAIRIIYELFSIQIQRRDDSFIIPISDYLKHSVNFHEREWKLVNRRVQQGFVYLSSHETVRLIRTELGTYIHSKIINSKTPEMISGFEESVNKLVLLSKKFVTATVDTGEYPPCIKHAIETLEKGENLPHSGRFMLATFLLSKGQSVSQIAPLFKNAPDYNPRVTLYQLNHLSGTGSSGKQYMCPSCETLKTQSLCFETPACNGIINPLQFGKKRRS